MNGGVLKYDRNGLEEHWGADQVSAHAEEDSISRAGEKGRHQPGDAGENRGGHALSAKHDPKDRGGVQLESGRVHALVEPRSGSVLSSGAFARVHRDAAESQLQEAVAGL